MATQRKSDLTREHILSVGRDLVLKKGFGGVGLKELLELSEVPKGSFYYYFPSKEAFGCELLRQYCATYLDRLDLWLSGSESGRDRLLGYFGAWRTAGAQAGLADRCLVVKLAAEISDLSEDMRLILQGGVERLVGRLARVIEEGLADSSIAAPLDAKAAAQALYGLFLGAAILAKLAREPLALETAMQTAERLLASPETPQG